MTLISIDLASRYASAFGLIANKNQAKPKVSKSGKNYNLETYSDIDPEFESIKLTFENNEFNFASLPFLKQNEAPEGNILAPPPLISFSRDKQLIETPVNDSDNVVIERWGTNPWNIRMRGLLIDVENRHYPEVSVTKLERLFDYNGVVDASGTQFFDKNIASIYFKSIEISGVQGYQDTVQYTLVAKSITPVSFTLRNP
ncbi:hypothetical protein KORDIASMS9_02674 [Kordia sp. SMS9]|uniref:DUF6046 domain-containing protein n=1 Tax=Kordia sp. SMS9 TaxID=2282170 RepID=UPI000E0D3259|nr:DUF6046 domain-containing protein [Kordia sp. SMS9]AXG70434.1 hypothetical protein KORDIASMS9_02674 [Kordia sp. SMS9]